MREIQNRVDQTLEFCQNNSGNWELGGAAEWIDTATAHEEATCAGSLDSKISGIILIVLLMICLPSIFISHDVTTILCFTQNEDSVDYEDPFSVQAQISDLWWMMHNSCKYLLCCLVMEFARTLAPGHASNLLGSPGLRQGKPRQRQ